MKLTLPAKLLIVAVLTAGSIVGLTQTQDDDDKKKKIKKKVEIIKENGATTVRVETIEDGEKKVRVYEGEEAEAYLDDMHSERMKEKGAHARAMVFRFDSDSIDYDFDFDLDSMDKQIRIHMNKFDIDFDRMMDSMMTKHGVKMKIMVDSLDEMHGKLSEMLESLDIDIDIDIDGESMSINSRVDSAGVTKQMRISIIKVEGMENEEEEERLEIENLMVYPNPSEGSFKLKVNIPEDGKTKVTITDMTGKEVYRETVRGSGEQTIEFDLGDKEKGVYILNLRQGKKSISKKLIIQ